MPAPPSMRLSASLPVRVLATAEPERLSLVEPVLLASRFSILAPTMRVVGLVRSAMVPRRTTVSLPSLASSVTVSWRAAVAVAPVPTLTMSTV